MTVRVTGHTQLYGLLGWPVSHSLSPAMHNAAFAASGFSGVYVAMPVPPEAIEAAIAGLRALGFRGVNLTIPHKQSVWSLVEADALSQRIGAVNTLKFAAARVLARNTDAPGFLRDLENHGLRARGLRALVLGAGGAARACAAALADAEAHSVTVANRSLERAEALVRDFSRHWPQCQWRAVTLNEELQTEIDRCRLIVNATPVGLKDPEAMPLPSSLKLSAEHTVYDTLYGPERALGRFAQSQGARAFEGSGMLLEQGALAWEWWTGKEAPRAVMRAALSRPNESTIT